MTGGAAGDGPGSAAVARDGWKHETFQDNDHYVDHGEFDPRHSLRIKPLKHESPEDFYDDE